LPGAFFPKKEQTKLAQ